MQLAASEQAMALIEDESATLHDRLPAAQADLKAAIADERDQQRQLTEARARHAALVQLQRKVQQQGELGPWLQQRGLDTVAPLWRSLRVDAGWEAAVEAVLRERLAALPESETADAGDWLDAPPPATLALVRPVDGALSAGVPPAGCVPLSAHVQCEAPYADTVARWLAGVSLIVLLIACFNVANLLLARAARWRREMAGRMALGVSRGRLVGQLLTESLVLAGLAAVGALLLAHWGGDALHTVLLPDVAFTDAGMGGRLLTFLGVATLLTAALAGVLPALQATRADVADELRAGARGVSRASGRTRVALLVAQAALSVVLLIGAGLFVTSLRGARSVDLGFDAEGVALVRLEWTGELSTDVRHQAFQAIRDRVARLPGVENAALTYSIPFYTSYGMGTPRVPGLDSVPRHDSGGPYANKVGPEYFATMGLSILRGRGIEAADAAENAPPVAVVTESMADAYWPDDRAVGQCLIWGDEDEDPPCTTVVGVMENFHRQDLQEDDAHFQYVVNWSHPNMLGPAQAMVVRVDGPADEALGGLRAEVMAASTLVRYPVVQTLMDNVEPQLRSWRLGAAMFTVFGLLALVVAALGLYSVLAFDVALRQTELGIRAALGAGAGELVGMVLRRAVLLVALGTALGMAAALAGAPFVEPLLFGVSPRNPVVFAGVAVALIVVAGLAGSLPAWRVARVDPSRALQAE